ncbi:MAG: VOC family protein [Pseudolabrys sp.]|nr:VOC family protein [Pseudolabrys sp.]MDP2295639.1 VOC family protein [Pseudolabrys sp.]
MQVTPYLMLDGRCEEALEFYKKAVGAEIGMLMRFNEAPEGSCAPAAGDKVMHSSFKIGDTLLMASDGNNAGKPEFKGISLSINAKDEADADRMFKALGDGGQVQMPMDKTFFAKRFGMVADKFGVSWMIIAE